MKPSKSGTIAFILVCSFIAAEAGAAVQPRRGRGKKARPARVAELAYDVGVGGISEPVTANFCLNGGPVPSCVDFPTGVGEWSVTVKITDETGLPVPAVVEIHSHDATAEASRRPICGATTEPLPVEPGIPIAVGINVRDPAFPCSGVGTRGVVTATFSRT